MDIVNNDSIWERGPGEGARAFHAFTHYREMGAVRSIRAAWRQHRSVCEGRPEPLVDSLGFVERWSVRFRWVARARAWDDHMDRLAQEAHVKRQLDARERHASTAAMALDVVMAPVSAAAEVISDPAVMAAIVVDAGRSSKATMRLICLVARQAHAIQALVNVERMALGMSTVSVDIGPKDGRGNPIADAIARDPAVADLAIALLDRIAGTPYPVSVAVS